MYPEVMNMRLNRSGNMRSCWLLTTGCSHSELGPFLLQKVFMMYPFQNPILLTGLIRLVHFLSQNENFGCDQKVQLVVDSGTGTTAIGLALAVVLMGLPWEVVGIMLADTLQGYERQKRLLLEHFYRQFLSYDRPQVSNDGHFRLPLQWRLRNNTRKFGKVLDGDIETCQHVARETGILLDPIYTLASWEMAMQLCSEMKKGNGNGKVVMLHTGGTLGLFGLAQRFPSQFF